MRVSGAIKEFNLTKDRIEKVLNFRLSLNDRLSDDQIELIREFEIENRPQDDTPLQFNKNRSRKQIRRMVRKEVSTNKFWQEARIEEKKNRKERKNKRRGRNRGSVRTKSTGIHM